MIRVDPTPASHSGQCRSPSNRSDRLTPRATRADLNREVEHTTTLGPPLRGSGRVDRDAIPGCCFDHFPTLSSGSDRRSLKVGERTRNNGNHPSDLGFTR
jgi:hypothetical protein